MQKLTVTLYIAATLIVVVAIPLQRNVRDTSTSSSTYSCSDSIVDEILGTDPSLYVNDDGVEESKLSENARIAAANRLIFFSVMPKVSCKAWEPWKSNSSGGGLFRVSPTGGCEFKVYCDMCLESKGEGWMVIQRRSNGAVHFHNKSWNDYKTGFGDYLGEYWMGLEKLHEITTSGSYELHVGLESGGTFASNRYWAVYDSFSVSNEANNYKLTLSAMDTSRSYTDDSAFDRLAKHEGQPFTTRDRDNDGVSVNCANHTNLPFGGWWFGGPELKNHNSNIDKCIDSNLNGYYYAVGHDNIDGDDDSDGNGIKWKGVNPPSVSFMKTIMAIRRVN